MLSNNKETQEKNTIITLIKQQQKLKNILIENQRRRLTLEKRIRMNKKPSKAAFKAKFIKNIFDMYKNRNFMKRKSKSFEDQRKALEKLSFNNVLLFCRDFGIVK